MSEIKLPKIHVNAEFQRLWWTNVRWGLIAGVVLIFMLFLFAKPEWRGWSGHFKETGAMAMMLSALAGYILLERSLKQDVSVNAFDQLRMSALSAWQMAWSRMIVAPMMAWVVFGLGWTATLVGEKISNSTTWNEVIFLLALPFFGWGVACVVLTNALPVQQNKQRWNGSLVQIILLYIICMIWMDDFRNAVRDIKMNVASDEEFNDVGFYIFHEMTGFHIAIMFVIFAAIASVFVWARMANVLHLKNVDKIYAVLAVCAPVLAWWSLANMQTAAAAATLIYGGLTLASVAMQGMEINRFRLPVWALTAPLGILAAIMLQSFDVVLIWCQIAAFMVIVRVCTYLRLGVNSVTVALATYLLVLFLWAASTSNYMGYY
ncbi:hypothetical protein [Wielerella bovis]|uniref:hypothetical protein n=1 Tax=Wielerella bovis TaxID=2917790 RepID=UPI0020191F7C|nr:hypothetical protein [Wielerella bovis]MCG7657262.1 hypothetical protein [Wielerella bovis]MCG7659484.1 hypothetical protein [Wielerella bovis]